jgi:hypothetical protein
MEEMRATYKILATDSEEKRSEIPRYRPRWKNNAEFIYGF